MTSEPFENSETVVEVDVELGPDGDEAVAVVEETPVDVVDARDSVDGVDESFEDEAAEESVLVLEEASLPEAVLPVWEPTGNAAVDAALEDLHALADTDVNEHAAVYEKVQASLRATLDGLVSEDEPA
ncbi:hypothetical protein OAV85_02310 [Candidatus Nanopelagicales bacterium]|jgi:hypothetical protein|nr:hypothetical protein [Candidatus Nanopelagicales bacterium]